MLAAIGFLALIGFGLWLIDLMFFKEERQAQAHRAAEASRKAYEDRLNKIQGSTLLPEAENKEDKSCQNP